MSEIQRADPSARRAALAIIGIGTLVGGVLIAGAPRFRSEFEGWIRPDIRTRVMLVTAAVMALAAGPLLGLAAYLWHSGRRALRAGRYPPPGLRLLRDTPVVTGRAAARRGRLLQWLAVGLGMAALILAFCLWRLVTILQNGLA